MVAAYSVVGQQGTPATTDAGVVGVVMDSGLTVRPRIFDLIVASSASAADNSASFELTRGTTAGTATTVAPILLDPAEAGPVADGRDAYTTNPTHAAEDIVLQFALNQRATFRWVAAPGSEFVLPATANNCLFLDTPVVNSMGALVSTILFKE